MLGFEQRLEAGAHLGDVLRGQVEPEPGVLLRRRAGDALARRLGVYAVLGRRHEVVEAHEVRAEAGLAHLHALRRVRVLRVGVVRLEVQRLCGVDAVHLRLEVLLDELGLRAVEAAPSHRVLVEVLHDHEAPGPGVELGVELVEYLLELAAAQGHARVHFPVLVHRPQDHVPDLVGVAHEGEVLLDGREELLAHGPVVRRAHVAPPGKRNVEFVVELLDRQLAVGSHGEAHVTLVLRVDIVHH